MAHDDDPAPDRANSSYPDPASRPLSLPSAFHRSATGAMRAADTERLNRSGDTAESTNGQRTRKLIISALVLLLALVAVVGVIAYTAGGANRPPDSAAEPPLATPTKPANCTDGNAGQPMSSNGIDVGTASVPGNVLPEGWKTSTEALPMASRAQLTAAPVNRRRTTPIVQPASHSTPAPGTTPLFGLVTVPGQSRGYLRDTGEAFLRCLIYLPRYRGMSPLPPVITRSQDGVSDHGVEYVYLAARLATDADSTNATRGGDAVFLVVLGTGPVTIAVGIAPLGDIPLQNRLHETLTTVQIHDPRT
ncbi:MAG: hypothetical protein QM809_09220 [Gordonia sp. (in: high G+C Gram-positive bacteria)]|uniref:hypothetical protein n=1 Tax=Gordonia sp. (in: high G+C Gram-positive bacteria) TaxID=84139 RepID=UPI0039E42E53